MTRILLVEPDEETDRGAVGTLREDGVDVLDVPDGRDLLQRVRAVLSAGDRGTPTAVLAGVRPTSPSCADVLRAVREADQDLPVILAAPRTDLEGRAAAYRLGADAVVDEPLDPDQVLAALQIVLMQRPD